MEQPLTMPSLPAEYYRHHAARVHQLASEAMAAGIREHVDDVALQYDRLAERVESTPRSGRG
ncbi:MAG: hypothetical protein WA459_10700 [Stellaceae bacterium]